MHLLTFSILLHVMFAFGSVKENGSISKDELLGKFNPAGNADFVKVEKAYTSKPDIYLRKEAYEKFKEMATAAKKEGVKLEIISAARNFDYQKGIWERKWQRDIYKGENDAAKAKDIMRYSAMPGASRHHWGTDMDFNSVETAYFNSGAGKKMYDWLKAHGHEYGFCQPYTSKDNGRTGYEEEKWHWTYTPLSSVYLKEYNKQISYTDIKGFSGSGAAKEIRLIEDYVNGISADCK